MDAMPAWMPLDFDPRILLFVVIGFALMAATSMERVLDKLPFPVPLPFIWVALGWLVFSVPMGLPPIDPINNEAHSLAVEYLTEFIVIASLLAAGISIDRPWSWRGWGQVKRLIIIAMPITITAIAVLGWGWLGLAPASAILLAASLAPTDPVLAKSVSVGPPGEDERDDVRFDLTVEAGLNDGLAFPFTYLAIAAVGVAGIGEWTWDWFAFDFVWRIFAGIAVGIFWGRLSAWYVFNRLPESDHVERSLAHHGETSEGLIVLGSLLLAYGLAEVVEGYGFLAVFAGAVAAKQYHVRKRYHRLSHHFIGQIEEIVLVAMLIGFGGLLASGILGALTWPGVAVGLVILFVVRPVSCILASIDCKLPWPGRLAVAFFGVRGMGTIYYLAYGQNHAEFAGLEQVWAVAAFTILASIVIHGLLAQPVMEWLDRRGLNVLPGMPESEFDDPGAKPLEEMPEAEGWDAGVPSFGSSGAGGAFGDTGGVAPAE